MDMALVSLAMMLLYVMSFHIRLNWHKNYGHWHWHASDEHHQAVELKRIVHGLMVPPNLQGNVMVVVLCYCFGHSVVEAMVLTKRSATIARLVLSDVLDRCGKAAKAASWLSAYWFLCRATGCVLESFSIALLPWQQDWALAEMRVMAWYLSHRVVDYCYCYCSCYCCCCHCVHLLCFG